MSAVFSHGRLRLYLLKLLAEGPRHGYELIRLLENRFLGLYAPSAGTIYPRLQRLEAEGLITHTATGGRKTYEITDAGRDELRQRAAEVSSLEADIQASVADLTSLASEIQQEVKGSLRDLKEELRAAKREARQATPAWGHWTEWVKQAADGSSAGAAGKPAPMPGEPFPSREQDLRLAVAELIEECRRFGPQTRGRDLAAAYGIVQRALAELRRLRA